MKLGKGTLLAIVESTLFLIGAIFFLLVLIIPSTPIWALIVGICFGLAGAIVWLSPLLVQMFHRISNHMKVNTASVEEISQKIQGSDRPENDTYELHRADSYDNLTDEMITHTEPKTETNSTTE